MKAIDYKSKSEKIIAWIQKTMSEAGFNKAVLAVSGGVDSATSLFLTVKALGAENVYAILMPYGTLGTKALMDGKVVAKAAGLEKEHIFVRDIKKPVDKIFSVIPELDQPSNPSETLKVRKGNIMARLRMVFLYDLSKELNALVVGTENLSEHYLGYFTRFGDEASDIEPIRNLYKTQVFELAKYLGVPQEIIDKLPSANLWEGQSDEGEFGFSYADADRVLYLHFEEGLSIDGIVDLGVDRKMVEKVLQFVAKNDFKHHLPNVFDKIDL